MRKPGKSHIKLYTKVPAIPEGWYCYEHGCWNSKRQRLCSCPQPQEQGR